MTHRIAQCRPLFAVVLLVRHYFRQRLAHDAAALTYYLLFAIFPLLIFLTNLVGIFALDVVGILRNLTGVIPRDVLELLVQYVGYISSISNNTLLAFSLVFSVWFPMRAASALLYSVRRIYHLPRPKKPLRFQFRVFFFTVFFIFTVLLSLLLSAVGETVLDFLFSHLPRVIFSDALVELWSRLRFVLLAALAFATMTVLFGMALERPRFRSIWPGVLLGMCGWVVVSLLFSLYVENAGRYSLIYGSIGAIIVLLLWLYLAASMMLIGAEFNYILDELRKDPSGGNLV